MSPRFRRPARRSGRPARGTNWLGRAAQFTAVTAGNTGSVTLVDPTTGEVGSYLDPTLVRIRGVVLIDWDNDMDAATNNGLAAVSIYAGLDNITVWSENYLSKENILFVDEVGMSVDSVTTAGTESNDVGYVSAWHYNKVAIDVKAMRRLGDSMKIFLNVHNLTVTGSVSLAYSYALRILVKE